MKVCILANQILGTKISSGGDVLSFEVLSRLKNGTITIGPLGARDAVRAFLPRTEYISSDDSQIIPGTGIMGGIEIIVLYLLRTARSFLAVRKLQKVDIVYLTGDFICDSIVAVAIKLVQPWVRIIGNFYHLNPSPFRRGGNSFLFSTFSFISQRASLMFIKKNSDVIFVLSEVGKDELLALKFDPGRLYVSGGGVNEDIIMTAPKTVRKFDAFYLGRMNKTKGIYDLISILDIVCKAEPSFRLAVAGMGSVNEVDNVRKLIKKRGLAKNFTYLGFITDRKKYSIMKSTPTFVLPSHEEGFGLVILEALACGMRVCAYDLEVLKNVFGVYSKFMKYAPLYDVQLFAENIIESSKKGKIQSLKIIPTWEKIAQERLGVMKKCSCEETGDS